MDSQRIANMQSALANAQIDALVCRLPENVVMLSGYWPLCGWNFVVMPADGKAVCIHPDTEEREVAAELWDLETMSYKYGVVGADDQFAGIQRALTDLKHSNGWTSIGYEGNFEQIAPAFNAAEQYPPAMRTREMLGEVFGHDNLVDATALILKERARKTDHEQEKIRIVNEISVFALEKFRETVVPGQSGVSLAAAVEADVMVRGTGYRGATKVRAFAQVATGPEETAIAYRPMEVTTTRTMNDGDVALLELAVVADGYWADRTRARVAGRPSDQQREINEVVRKAQEAATEAVAPGKTGGEVDAVARRIIAEAGYEYAFPHITGHALGLAYHEGFPMLQPGSSDILQPGMVHSVEPGIYFEPMGGIRIEDDVLVTQSGHEILGPFPKELV